MSFSRSLTGTTPVKNPKNPRNNPQTWYVNEKFSVIVDCFISLER